MVFAPTGTVLFGMPAADDRTKHVPVVGREPGMWGRCIAHVTCYEVQARGALHLHGLYWGGIPPSVLDAAGRMTPMARARVAEVMDSFISTRLPQRLHDEWVLRVRAGDRMDRVLWLKEAQAPIRRWAEAEPFIHRVFGNLQLHCCKIGSCSSQGRNDAQ